MKVLIYNFLGRANDFSDLLPSERFATMAGVLSHYGADVQIWDRGNIETLLTYPQNFLEELERLEFYDTNVSGEYLQIQDQELEKIIAEDFDVIFLNLWRGPGFKFSVELGKRIKQALPNVKIFAIGQSADRLRALLFKVAPYLDAIIYGLNYLAISGICEGLPYKELPNIIYMQEGKIVSTKQSAAVDFVELPLPIYDKDVYIGIEGKFPIYPVSLSNEACPFACPFCMRPASYGTEVVEKPISKAIEELKFLMNRYNARMFRIADSTPPYMALTRFSEAILEEDLTRYGILFSGFSRLDTSGGDDFEKLSQAGIKALFFGIETLDELNQKRIRKVYSIDLIKKRLASSYNAGIFNIGSFIFPLPGETRTSMENTLAKLKEISSYLGSVLIQPAGVYPETEWRDNPSQYGIKIFPDYDIAAPVYPVKYILPMRYWKPFPFTYDLFGKPAEQVKFQDIAVAFEEFCYRVKTEIGLPIGIQDYDFIAAKFLNKEHYSFTGELIKTFVSMDYQKIKALIDEAKAKLSYQD